MGVISPVSTIVHVLCCYSATNQNIIIIEQDKPKGLRMSEIVNDNDREEREQAEQQKRESYNMLLILVVRMREHAHYTWSSKNLINWNQLKKFMQVCVDVTCMYTNFGGRGLSGFGDTATLKNSQISLSDHGL